MSRSVSSSFLLCVSVLCACASGGVNPGGGGRVPFDAGRDLAPPEDADIDDALDAALEDAEPPKDDLGPPDLGLCDDADGDGFPRGAGCAMAMDCDDARAEVSPAGVESCNAIDDDCDGSIDEDFGGTVTCGTGACARTAPACADGRTDTCAPGTPGVEACNAIDDDCDGMIDEDFGGATSCGLGACLRTVSACAGGMSGTCTPGTPTPEVCNGIDDDCNGLVDEGLPALVCGVGGCQRTVAACSGGAPQACVPGAAGTEACNASDDDCDGMVDESLAPLTCGVGACARTVVACVGGVTQACTPGAPGTEACNGVDDDCDGAVDESLGTTSCGVGACGRAVEACVGGAPGICTPGTPGTEACNGVDDDCDGTVDDGVCAPSAPTNDTCTGAILLTGAGGMRTTDTLVGATANTTDCGLSGVEVFYRVSVSVRSVVYLDTFGTGFDTSLSYRGTSCPGAAAPCEDDDCGTLQDQLVVVVEPGTHHFAVHARSSFTTPGPISLRWQILSAASGTNTRLIATGSFVGTTSGTSGAIAASCGGSAGSGENGYHFTVCPGAVRTVSADTCTAAYDTVLHLRGPAGELACDDDSCGILQSRLTSVAASGVGLYQLVVDGYPLGSLPAGAYTLAVTGF